MASSFLTRQANKQAKKIEQEYGASAYGGTASLRPSSASTTATRPAAAAPGGESAGPVSRASSFLTKQAQKSAAKIDREYGADSYGGSRWTALDKESGLRSWLDDVSSFSQRMSEDYAGREGRYQSADTFGKYRDDAFASIGAMENRSNIYRNYFEANRDLYGDDTVNSILSTLDEGDSYLESVRGDLGSEYDYWSQWDTEDAYNDYQRQSTLDIDAAREQLAALEEQLEAADQERRNASLVMSGVNLYGTQDQRDQYGTNLDEKNTAYEDLDSQVTTLRRDIEQAENIQRARRYSDYLNADDFAEYSAQGAAIENPTQKEAEGYANIFGWRPGSKPVGNIVTYSRDNYQNIALGEANNSQMIGSSLYHYMTDDEVNIYNYLLAKEGAEAAQEYLDFLEETLNYRFGSQQAENIEGIQNPVGRTAMTALYGLGAGLDQFGSGVRQLFSSDRLPTTATQFGSAQIREGLEDIGPEFLGSSLAQMGYDALTTTANMAPSILLSAVTGGAGAPAAVAAGAGALTLGASASGNAYNQALSEGYAEDEARNYSLLIGASEAGLQYVLGGIGSLGGRITGKTAQAAVQNIDNALFRVAADIGIRMAGEGTEEYLQEILEPAFRNLMFDENNEVRLVTEEAAYSFLLGALTAGLMEAGGVAATDINLDRTGAAIRDSGKYETLLENALTLDPSSASYQMAQQMQSGALRANNGNVGQLFAAYAQDGGNLDFMQEVQKNDVKNAHVLESNQQEWPVQSQNKGETDSNIPEATRQAVEMLARGEEISGNQAARIAESEEAVSLLSQLTGEEINTDAPISRVKSDIRALARRTGGASDDTGTTATEAQASPQQATERPTAQQAYDIRRVQQAASSLGESGSRALTAAYDGSVDAGSFYAGFASYYEAGVSGLDIGKVRSEYADTLNEAQRYAAYTAGQNDAAASLQRERSGVQFATVYGDEAGFIPSDYSRNLSQDTVRFYNDLGRAAGVKITVAAATGDGGANGWYRNGTVYIAADAENAGEVVAKHEITHRLQEIAPEEYRKYRDYAVNALAERDGSTAALVERYKSRYAESGVNLTTEQAMDEIAADFTEALMVDPSRFETLARENRSIARRLLDALRSFIDRVKSLFRGKNAQDRAAMSEYGVDMDTLEQAARLWEEALRAGREQVKSSVVGTEGGYATVDGKFSLKGVVEDNGTLLALHNLNEDKLRSALRLGGFPMPSIAVTRVDIPHTNFGDITLVMSRQTVDPRANRRNTVYSADAWTPTFPAVEYESDPQVERRISRRIGELSAQVDPFFRDDLRRIQYGQDDYLNRHGGEDGLVRWAMDNYGLKAAYLEEQGHHITAATTQREADRGYDPERAPYYEAIADVLGTTDPEAINSMNLKELRDKYGEALEQAYPGMTKSAFRMSNVLRRMGAYFSDQGGEPTYETITDGAATRRAVDEALDQTGYERWVRELYSGVEAARGIYNNKERFTPSGNRRSFQQTHYPVTLDNITKAMVGQNNGNSRNVSGFHGIKSLRAGMAERFKSVADMHRLEGRLQDLTQEEADAISDALDSRLSAIMEELAEKSPGGSRRYDYMEMDAIGNILMEIAESGTYTIDSIMRKLNEDYHYHVGNELAANIRDLLFGVSQMPVNLFEAKPERSVHFDEVLAAVLPDNVASSLSDELLDAGVGQVLTYEEGNDADRLAKVNSVEGARFSLKSTDSQGRELTEEQREFFRDSKITDADGRLLTLYHGTTAYGEITKFRKGRSGWLGPGIYLSSKQVDAQRYADAMGEGNGQIYELYANVTNPLVVREGNPVPEILRAAYGRDSVYRSRSEKQGNDTQILTTADIKKLQSKGYDGIRWDFGGSTEVSVFSPEQIKRIDNLSPTSSSDIRHSVRGSSDILRQNAALQEENSLLRERVEYWRGQTRRTERVTTDKKSVERAARELIRNYNADLETADIAGDLQSLYDYIASGRDGNDELTYTEARRRADAIARKLVDSASVMEDSLYQEYRDLRKYLRTTRLTISEEESHDIQDFGDFRRRNFGRMNIGRGNTNIDQVYQEMASLWPEFFDEQREIAPSEQLIHISEVLDGIYQVTERNPFSDYFDEAITDASNEIMERFFDLPQTRATFADRQARKLEDAKAAGRRRLSEQRERSDTRLSELRQQNRERVQRAIQRERETRQRQLDRLKTRYAARDAAGRERRSARELRARISRHAADLSRRLLRPSDKQHIPEQLRTAVAAMLDAINLESVYTVDPATGQRRKGGNGDPTKRTEAFRALRQAYANITKEGADYTLIVDPDLADNLTELEAMRGTPLAEMSTAQLTTVWATLRAVEASIRTANRMLGESRFRTISQVADGIRNDNIMRQDRGDYRGILGKVDRLVNLDMLTPQGYFHRMGPTGDALFRMLRSAQDRHIEIMRGAQEATRDIIGSLDVNKLERETHTFDVDGQKLTMSTAQIMSLYELMKREQARDHIFVGGIRPETIRTGRGLRESRRADAAHVSVETLAEITGVLTEEQVKIADALQKYMGGRLSELGNQASMEVYGYRKFTEPNYFPIQVDRNQTQRDIAKEAQAQTIAGRGFTKGTVPKANDAVMVGSIFDIFASHVNDMATYAAWLPTMENVRRIRDFTFRDSEGNRTGTVKSVIERVFGRSGNAYLNKLVDDLNQGVRATGSGNFMDGIVGNYKAAAVAANLRVIAQQPTAILRALNTLDAKYLLEGTVKRGDWEKVMKYAPIARWKDWGYFDINTGRQMKDVLLGNSTRLEKLRQAGMAGAGKADSIAWARLWNAVEAETKDRRPGLKPGTDAFYRAVGERFSEIVDQTQVVDGILQRSQIMRSPDALTKISTSFMGEPTKSYNMFVNAVYDLRHATGKQARNRAGKALARTSTALVASFTINAIMQSIVDGLRDDDKELDYWEKVFQSFTGFTGDEETLLDYWNSFWSGNLEASYNPLAYMPYFKDLVSIAQGYDVTRMDMEAVEKVWAAFTNMRKALSGDGKYSIAGASANMMAEVARLLGLPVANLKRDVQAVATTAAIETDNYLMQYRMDKALLNIGYQGNRSNFMDILYAASVNDPEAYEIIYEDMVASGITEDQIRTAMESRMKEDQGVESVADLSRRYLTPNQERAYDRLHGQISRSSVWQAASAEQRAAVEEDIYALTTGTDAGVKLQEKIDGGAAYGITDADYLLYLAAREIADGENEDPEKRNGSIDQTEAQAAIDMLTGLTDEGRAYLWQSTNKGWSEEKNPYR